MGSTSTDAPIPCRSTSHPTCTTSTPPHMSPQLDKTRWKYTRPTTVRYVHLLADNSSTSAPIHCHSNTPPTYSEYYQTYNFRHPCTTTPIHTTHQSIHC